MTEKMNWLLTNKQVTEILFLGHSNCWIEQSGTLSMIDSPFSEETEFENFVHQISLDIRRHLNLERPFVNGRWNDFRIQMVDPVISQSSIQISMRRITSTGISFEKLRSESWTSEENFKLLAAMVEERRNVLIVGPTGVGKSTILNVLLSLISPNERAIVIEDTQELDLPNAASSRMLARESTGSGLPDVTQQDLVKHALRLRPDRIIMGEMRNVEAKDFLLALSTGHKGSMATIHSDSATKALNRVELLVQLGAPQWSLDSVRKIIFSSIDYIIVLDKVKGGKRILKTIHKIASLEENGFLLERCDDGFY